MAWTKHEPSRPGNLSHAVYSEIVDNDFDKTLTITSDLGAAYVIRPNFIEIFYTAVAIAATRVLQIVVTRDGLDIFTMTLDSATHPQTGEVKRVYLWPTYGGAGEAELASSSGQHGHILPPLVLGQGDAIRIHSLTGGQAADDMHLFIHAQVLSGITTT